MADDLEKTEISHRWPDVIGERIAAQHAPSLQAALLFDLFLNALRAKACRAFERVERMAALSGINIRQLHRCTAADARMDGRSLKRTH
jgi:hypothetical protein